MATEKETEDRSEGIDRRTVLKGAAAGAGIIGMSGVATARGGGGPCFKEFGCGEDETYVKIEFVTGADGDCWFEEETDTGLVTIDSFTSKDGESCEPIEVEWSVADGYRATRVMAYGGQDCVRATNPDPDRSFEPGLEGPGGRTAAISNLQFCIGEVREILGTINLSYEDLPMENSDWDYNDWTIDVLGTFTAAGVNGDGVPLVTNVTFDLVPQARGAGDNHRWGMIFSSDDLCGSGDYSLERKDATGAVVSTASDTFDGSSDVDIEVWAETADVFDDLTNTGGSCTLPNEWATLTMNFDEPCPLEIPAHPSDLGVHATALFFNPYLDNFDSGVFVDQGDVRLVAVPQDWNWPLEREHIADVYDDVSKGTDGVPSFDSPTWYEDGFDSTLATQCDADTGDLGGS